MMDKRTLAEFKEGYGSATERRVELYERFEEWLATARSTGALRRVWVFGSFATEKPGPGDLDILAQFAADFDPSGGAPDARSWFDHQLARELHEIDFFYVSDNTPEDRLVIFLQTFGRDRDGRASILEVTL